MKTTERHFTASLIGWFLVVVTACGGLNAGSPTMGSETHFLLRCSLSCDDGLECLDGVCTSACGTDAECGALDASASCMGEGDQRSCQIGCDTGDACPGSDMICSRGRCVQTGTAVLAGVPGPLGDPSGSSCAAPFEERAPVDVATTAEVIPGSAGVIAAVADESGVYWLGLTGAVYFSSRAQGARPDGRRPFQSRLLWSPEAEMADRATNLVLDDENVYLGARQVRVIPRAGGEAMLLGEVDLVSSRLVAAASGSVVLRDESGAFHLLSEGGELRELSHIPPGATLGVDGESVYFASNEPGERRVFVAPLLGGMVEPIGTFAGRGLVAERGTLLWVDSVGDGSAGVEERLTMRNLQTGCVQGLPRVGGSIYNEVLDPTHAYWTSYPGGRRSPPSPTPEDSSAAIMTLLRADRLSGTLETLAAPDFDVYEITEILTDNSDALFLRETFEPRQLYGIAKPD